MKHSSPGASLSRLTGFSDSSSGYCVLKKAVLVTLLFSFCHSLWVGSLSKAIIQSAGKSPMALFTHLTHLLKQIIQGDFSGSQNCARNTIVKMARFRLVREKESIWLSFLSKCPYLVLQRLFLPRSFLSGYVPWRICSSACKDCQLWPARVILKSLFRGRGITYMILLQIRNLMCMQIFNQRSLFAPQCLQELLPRSLRIPKSKHCAVSYIK